MATNLETSTTQGEIVPSRPGLKITGLHIKGLKSIGSLDLPEDGVGWNGAIPDFLMVGGINGSGKTTLLEFLASALSYIEKPTGWSKALIPTSLVALEAWIDIKITYSDVESVAIRFLVGDEDFVVKNGGGKNWYGISRDQASRGGNADFARFAQFRGLEESVRLKSGEILLDPSDPNKPAVIFYPSEKRSLIVHAESHKYPWPISHSSDLVQRWNPPKEWKDTLEARLYSVRWEDLNAKEEGRVLEATGFESYSRAFNRFFEGRKQIRWTSKGELVVETRTGAIHDLSELSSGEKQVILFMGELLQRWRPGSLVLIDEPELHLHESYQTKLWEALVAWQKERGGQVIVATQSAHFFGLGSLGTRLILGRRSR